MDRFQAQTNSVLDEELERVRSTGRSSRSTEVWELDEAEATRLADILERRQPPTPAMREALRWLADPDRRPPPVSWEDDAA